MMRSTTYFSRLIMLALMVVLLAAGGCKSKKKAMEAANAAALKAKTEQEAAMRKQKEEEERKKAEADAQEKARRDAEAQARAKAESAPAVRLGQYFNAIANAGTTESANNSIREALSLFASDETPVLIVISESGGQKDYDRPTTIKAYLNYVKDQKKNINPVSNLEYDASGKITSLELRKQN